MLSIWKRLKNLWLWSELPPSQFIYFEKKYTGQIPGDEMRMAKIIKRRDPIKEVLKNDD